MIEIDEKSTITGVDADAVLALINPDDGEDKGGIVKLFPDIKQLVEMMHLRGELIPGRLFWIAIDQKFMICIIRGSQNQEQPNVGELVNVINAIGVKTINIPNDAAFIGLLMQYQHQEEIESINFRACGSAI